MSLENSSHDPVDPQSPLKAAVEAVLAEPFPEDVVERVKLRAKQLAAPSNATVTRRRDYNVRGWRISRVRVWASGIVVVATVLLTATVLLLDRAAYQSFADVVNRAKADVFLGGDISPSVEELLKYWDQGCQAIHSYDVFVDMHQETYLDVGNGYKLREKPLKSHSASHQILSGEKRRIETDIEVPRQTAPSVVIWDGKLSKTYNSQAKQLRLEPTLNYMGVYIDYEGLYRNLTGTMSFMDALRQRPELIVEGKEKSSFILYTPPILGNYEFSPFGFRVWLDSDKNFMPVRIQRLLDISGEEIISSQNDTTVKQIEPGVWAPVESINLAFPPVPRRELPVVKPQRTVETVDLNRSRFNIDVSDSAFALEIPSGTKVYDKISNTHYVFGSAVGEAAQYSQLVVEGKEDVDKLRSFASEDMRPDLSTSRNPPAPRKTNRTLTWLVALNVGAVLIAAAILFVRRTSTKNI
ncbi:MAG: hypothetical protein WEB58_18640 [Planctomycetaceae bacterium]